MTSAPMGVIAITALVAASWAALLALAEESAQSGTRPGRHHDGA